jgi:hypothetical protein
MLKAIKIRLYPENQQIIYINKLFGSSRHVPFVGVNTTGI